MNKIWVCLCSAIFSLNISFSALAAETARDHLFVFSKNLNGLSGQFAQAVFDAKGKKLDSSKGTLALKAPRHFRWQYQKPFPQLIVADGLNVWIYDEDLAQVTVRPQSSAEGQSPLTVLTDFSLLDREYTTKNLADREQMQWLRLTPKAKEPPFVYCDLGFSGKDLKRMVVKDQLAQRSEWTFSGWKRNPNLDPEMFRFLVPKGVDVVGEPVKGADVFPVQ
jgi:outer membrane lipoprotein carrier protein